MKNTVIGLVLGAIWFLLMVSGLTCLIIGCVLLNKDITSTLANTLCILGLLGTGIGAGGLLMFFSISFLYLGA